MANDVADAITLGTPIYPDVAVDVDGNNNDITDPVSSQPNTSFPAAPIVSDGWPGNGIPIFSDFIKLFRLITQWVRWLYPAVTNLYRLLNGYFNRIVNVSFALQGTAGGTVGITLTRTNKTITLSWSANIASSAGLAPTGLCSWLSTDAIPVDFCNTNDETYNLGLCRVSVGGTFQYASAEVFIRASTHEYFLRFYADPDYTTDFTPGDIVLIKPCQFQFTLLNA